MVSHRQTIAHLQIKPRRMVEGCKNVSPLVIDVKDIIKKEEPLIEYIIDKNRDNFSLDLFKTEYA